MNFPSIRIEGQIFSGELLQRLEQADMPGQNPAAFGLRSDTKVKDEIAKAWSDAQLYYRSFRRKLESLPESATATTETRNLLMVPLFSLLGYRIELAGKGEEINGKPYPISHRVIDRDNFPVHILGWRDSLDKRRDDGTGPRMSPHALVQEYLNLTEHLYGIVTNGHTLRLLRDSTRLIRQNLIEFDLERIFDEDLFADFAILYRLLHASRLPTCQTDASSCLLERYHQDALDQGSRIRDGLRDAVEKAIVLLGTGFLSHPGNQTLRNRLALVSSQAAESPATSALSPQEYYYHLLRLVYRFLFLLVAEERGLIMAPNATRQQRDVYQQYYSISRLRHLAEHPFLFEKQHQDLWQGLLSTFRLFEFDGPGRKLGVTPLGGHLFATETLGALSNASITNADLLQVIRTLCFFEGNHRQISVVNYGALATEEFGSVYESLLELNPVITDTTFSFRQVVVGNERKTTGSYYTPDSLVQCLLNSALDPVVTEAIKGLRGEEAVKAILKLKVCDPACGSGHFLVAAAHRLAHKVAVFRTGEETPSLAAVRHALRDVVSHCIYGVDINPMAVELCKVSLWLEAVDPGKPLSFLDHHIQCGNSLLGTTPKCIAEGIPDAAYEPIAGDTKEAARWMRNLNRDARKGQGTFDFSTVKPWDRLGNLPAAIAQLDSLDDDTPETLRAKEKLYSDLVHGIGYDNARLLYDAWCAAFVWPKNSTEYDDELTTEHLRKIERNPHSVAPQIKAKIRDLARQYQFFHWHLAFPTAFDAEGNGGFDIILGNPPWERVNLKEKEWFAERCPEIANAVNAAARKRLIAQLQVEIPELYRSFLKDIRKTEGESHLLRNSGLYPLCGRGDINLYAVFAEGMRNLLNERGRTGCVLPTGIATDDTTKFFFQDVVEKNSLVSLFDFENKGIFPGVHNSYKFCLFTSGRGMHQAAKNAMFVFFAHNIEDLRDPNRYFTLSAEDIALLNPNTHTCPIFRSSKDALLTKKICKKAPVFIADNQSNVEKWNVEIGRMFHSSDDSALFLENTESSPENLLLYEAKSFTQFDHRFSTYSREQIDVEDKTKQDPTFQIRCRYVVPVKIVPEKFKNKIRPWVLAYRLIARSTDIRTLITTVLPQVAVVHSANIFLNLDILSASSLSATLNSFAADFLCRQAIGGTNLSLYVLQQVRIFSPSTFTAPCPWSAERLQYWILPRILELTYTAWDLKAFAKDCGYDGPPFKWDENRRLQLRCELDAAFFHLYLPAEVNGEWRMARKIDGCPYDETPEQLAELKKHFPTPRDAVAYIMDTFPIVKRKDEAAHGTYRTKDTILAIYDAMQEAIRTGQPYQTRLNPPPGPPSDVSGRFIPMTQWDISHWPSHIHISRENHHV